MLSHYVIINIIHDQKICQRPSVIEWTGLNALFFIYTVSKWNNLPLGICHSKSVSVFKNALLKRIRPSIKFL